MAPSNFVAPCDLNAARLIESKKDSGSLKTRTWLRTQEIAEYLGLTEGSIRNLVYRGQLRPKRLGSRLYFSREEIDRLIETST